MKALAVRALVSTLPGLGGTWTSVMQPEGNSSKHIYVDERTSLLSSAQRWHKKFLSSRAELCEREWIPRTANVTAHMLKLKQNWVSQAKSLQWGCSPITKYSLEKLVVYLFSITCSLRNKCSRLGSFLWYLSLVALVGHSPWKCLYKCLLYLHASLDSCWQSRNPSPDSYTTSAPSLYQLAQTHGKLYCALLWAVLQWPCALVLAHVHTAVVPTSLSLLFCPIHPFQLVAGLWVCHCSVNEPHWSHFHKSCGEALLCFSSFTLAAVRSLHKF